MYLEIYLDVIFLINFAMDLVLLYIVKKILKCSGTKLRMLSGAIFGAAGACLLAIIPDMTALLQFLITYIFLCLGMIMIAFPLKGWKLRIKAVAVLYITTFFLGGVLNSIYYNSMLGYYFRELIHGRLIGKQSVKYYTVAIFAVLAAAKIFIKFLNGLRKPDQQIYNTEIVLENRSIQIMGLLDTGNNLYDPIYGKPVIVAAYSEFSKLLSDRQNALLKAWIDTLEGKGSTLELGAKSDTGHDNKPLKIVSIPYQSIGKRKGLLPAVTVDQVIIKVGEEQICNDKVLTAVSMDQLSKQNKYQVILHRDIV